MTKILIDHRLLEDVENFLSDIDIDDSFNPPTATWGKDILRRIKEALAAPADDYELERRVDGAWSQFCAGIGDGADAPYPGMIRSFETHYGQSFADKDWRNEASVWAAAWKSSRAAPAPADDVARDALEQMLDDMGTDGLCVCQATKDLAVAAMKEKQNG